MIKQGLITVALTSIILLGDFTASAEDVTFIACPIYRDTDQGKKSGCWLSDDPNSGQRYDISNSPTKPDWNYGVLVEGTISDTQDNACGGITMSPVRVSILTDKACTRHMLPTETYPGREFVLPDTRVAPLSAPRAKPTPPHGEKTFSLFFDLDRTFFIYQLSDHYLDNAISWIRATEPTAIHITGYADTRSRVIDGFQVEEAPRLAQERAEKVAFALKRLGVPEDKMTVEWSASPTAWPEQKGAMGLDGPSRRRVDIKVIP